MDINFRYFSGLPDQNFLETFGANTKSFCGRRGAVNLRHTCHKNFLLSNLFNNCKMRLLVEFSLGYSNIDLNVCDVQRAYIPNGIGNIGDSLTIFYL